jgi:Na+/H+-dicarboxylate symporter
MALSGHGGCHLAAHAVEKTVELAPYFTIAIPPVIDVMAALVLSFVIGLTTAYAKLNSLKHVFNDFKETVSLTISKVIITAAAPLYLRHLPQYDLLWPGLPHLVVFAQIIAVIFVLHILILVYQFVVAGAVAHRIPFRLLWNMLPAYMTALGTSSSAATIPVTLKSTLKNGVSGGVAGFVSFRSAPPSTCRVRV